jgi:exopolyphosphatase/guanosine-5'-triphosphate,3'-diphosphate pyrophosphatase
VRLRLSGDISRVRPRPIAVVCARESRFTIVRRACIDIGSNTTRLLVADCDGDRLLEVHQERAFTHIRRGLTAGGEIREEKIAEVATVVAAQLQAARELGAIDVRGVATAAVRRAGNRGALVSAVRRSSGLGIEILSDAEEARLAFAGAARTLGYDPAGPLGVVDAGGGSCELVVGSVPDQVSWFASFEIGSGAVADECLHSDPPSDEDLSRARARVREVFDGVRPPATARVVAVGGSATSLRRIAGPVLDAAAFARTLALLTGARTAELARRFALDEDRARLLPAGLLILQAAAELFGTPLEVANGGLREGLLLEVRNG